MKKILYTLLLILVVGLVALAIGGSYKIIDSNSLSLVLKVCLPILFMALSLPLSVVTIINVIDCGKGEY